MIFVFSSLSNFSEIMENWKTQNGRKLENHKTWDRNFSVTVSVFSSSFWFHLLFFFRVSGPAHASRPSLVSVFCSACHQQKNTKVCGFGGGESLKSRGGVGIDTGVSPCFTRVFGFDGGEGLKSRGAPVFYKGFWI